MSEVTEMSTVDLYTKVRFISDQITAHNKTIKRTQETVDELLERKQELIDEIWRRDNERFR